MSSSLRNNLKAYMESVGDLVIVVDDILPFLANVHLYKKGIGQLRNQNSTLIMSFLRIRAAET